MDPLPRSLIVNLVKITTVIINAILLVGCTSTAAVDSADEPSFDGLIPLEGTTMSRVWIREGYTLAPYTRVMLVGAGIQYRPVGPPRRKMSSSGDSAFPLSEDQRIRLEQLITEEFDKALDRLEMEEVDTPGPDVLKVRGTIMDVVSRVPPDTSGPNDYWLDSVGQATFMIELMDSESGAVLIRGVDTRAAQTPGYSYQSNSVTNTAEARRLFSRWANMLVDALNDLRTLESENLTE